MTFKDLFSQRAPDYARFRPSYPPELFSWLAAETPGRAVAVDLGSGNGQAAVALGAHFDRVLAIDPSAEQLASATTAGNVEYRRGVAEDTGLAAASIDLITVAQAFHWFDHARFFAEARRIVRPGGLLAVWCYGLAHVTPEVDAAVHELYETRLGAYWEPERHLVETGYATVTVPFPELEVPRFEMHLSWTFEQLTGYLGTWSALRRYIEKRGEDPLATLMPALREAWGEASDRAVLWPLSVRAFRL